MKILERLHVEISRECAGHESVYATGRRKFAGQRPTFYHCATQPIAYIVSSNTVSARGAALYTYFVSDRLQYSNCMLYVYTIWMDDELSCWRYPMPLSTSFDATLITCSQSMLWCVKLHLHVCPARQLEGVACGLGSYSRSHVMSSLSPSLSLFVVAGRGCLQASPRRPSRPLLRR